MKNFRKIRRKNNFRLRITARQVIAVVVLLVIMVLAVPISLRALVLNEFNGRIYQNIDSVPQTRVAIVFGAGLSDYGREPSSMLEDRIMTAVDLYKKGTVSKIIMSGDNRAENYNEPKVMIDFAKKQGVRELDLQPDYAGRRTYDTCYRAREIFGLTEAILVTQEFHLPRALYICNTLGLRSIGVVADRRLYLNTSYFQLRDSIALTLAFWELYVQPPEVVLGERISI